MQTIHDFNLNNGKFNMDEDSRLLNLAIQNKFKKPILRLYGWTPACVSLGRNQKDDSIDLGFCKKHNLDAVRRLTGGRALLHDKEVTYSFVCDSQILKNPNSVILSYQELSGILIKAFSSLGIELNFPQNKKINSKFDYCMSLSTGADLCYKGRKFIGSAQYRKNGYILQHGSILFDYDKDLLEKIFNEKVDDNTIIALNQISEKINKYEVCDAIKKSFIEFSNNL